MFYLIRFHIYPNKVVHIYRCSDTRYIVFNRTIIQCIAQIKTYFCSTMEQQSIRNGIGSNFERAYANSVANGSCH